MYLESTTSSKSNQWSKLISISTHSQVLTSKDMKSTYHVILAFVIYGLLANAFYLYTHPDQMIREFRFVLYSFQHIEIFYLQEIVYHAILFFLIYPITNLWVSSRAKSTPEKLGRLDAWFTVSIVAIIGSYYLAQLAVIIRLDINPVMSIALIAEKVRCTYEFANLGRKPIGNSQISR